MDWNAHRSRDGDSPTYIEGGKVGLYGKIAKYRALLPATRKLGVGIIAYSPLGRVAQDIRRQDVRQWLPRVSDKDFPKNLELVDKFRAAASSKYGGTPGQTALAWMLFSLIMQEPVTVSQQGQANDTCLFPDPYRRVLRQDGRKGDLRDLTCAANRGVTFWDTADTRRAKIFLATKSGSLDLITVAVDKTKPNRKSSCIEQQLENSLTRLFARTAMPIEEWKSQISVGMRDSRSKATLLDDYDRDDHRAICECTATYGLVATLMTIYQISVAALTSVAYRLYFSYMFSKGYKAVIS
ncbi:uncharacterized protein LAESUDRAFT_752943 [Laetiporus sulphureus 93-53]|uniref:NADP-dependent oxidoreductase domain-containing protein n=1 Tax=Laetiporus sulphureus 93-53 TaxID=1314785 RepID=A0A165BFP4_9APHY|nr:uncharacterized protein LAESUDRAFT_752943 [Laetiporus sulphureus 93-53]KZT00957.1 hypothetical protein LAESUDRAFT_752943 [Laetiporus sulphureus 93-53]